MVWTASARHNLIFYFSLLYTMYDVIYSKRKTSSQETMKEYHAASFVSPRDIISPALLPIDICVVLPI